MKSINEILKSIREELPPPGELDEGELAEFEMLYLDEFLGASGNIWEYGPQSKSEPSDELKPFYHWLCYAQSVCGLYESVAWGGLLSIFYNGTGQDLNVLSDSLRRFDDPASSLIDEAYDLLNPVYSFAENTNFVTANRSADPFEIVPDQIAKKIERIEAEIGRLQSKSYGNACSTYEHSL